MKKGDGKRYTLTLKDELLPRRSDGREQSTVSWEYDFEASDEQEVFVAWKDLKATYRGREKKDAEPLKLDDVRRISLMMRRFVLPCPPFDVSYFPGPFCLGYGFCVDADLLQFLWRSGRAF